MVTVMSGFWSPIYVSCFRFKYNDCHCIYHERKRKHAWMCWGLTFRGPGDSLCAYVKGVYRGVCDGERDALRFSLLWLTLYTVKKIYKFTVRNKYHCGHHAMQINVHTIPYNFLMLYICRNSKIIFWPHFIQKECSMRNKREERACLINGVRDVTCVNV